MRLLVTVAHPDDETFGCGSVLAHAAANGVETVVVCATRGELGIVVDGSGPVGTNALGERREGELRAAAAVLGVGRVDVLGWSDSGVDGEPARGSLVAADPNAVEAELVRIIDDVGPDIVITLDASDGHRDHTVIRDATLAAVRRSARRPTRTYMWCLPRSLMSAFTGDATLGTPDETITTIVDTSAHLDVRWRAMRAHASQAPPYDSMPPALQQAFLTADHLVRVDPPWTGGVHEHDWLP